MELTEEIVFGLLQSDQDFPIDFDDAWKWVEYAQKKDALRKLRNNFLKDIDYLGDDGDEDDNKLAFANAKASYGGHNRRIIFLTVDCFKSFCMMAGTSKGGFINGTAMCSAYNKNIVDWFRTTRTFNLFCSLASDLGIKSNMVLHHDLDISRLSATKYVEMFPGLIRLKRGSPENGGGVWIHPDVSIDLAQERIAQLNC